MGNRVDIVVCWHGNLFYWARLHSSAIAVEVSLSCMERAWRFFLCAFVAILVRRGIAFWFIGRFDEQLFLLDALFTLGISCLLCVGFWELSSIFRHSLRPIPLPIATEESVEPQVSSPEREGEMP